MVSDIESETSLYFLSITKFDNLGNNAVTIETVIIE